MFNICVILGWYRSHPLVCFYRFMFLLVNMGFVFNIYILLMYVNTCRSTIIRLKSIMGTFFLAMVDSIYCDITLS